MLTKEVLHNLYIKEHLTMREIGEKYSLSRQNVCYLIKKHNIPTENAGKFTISCDRCGKEYQIFRKHLRRDKTHFCSYDCYFADRKNDDYIPHRNGQRKARLVMASHIGRKLLKEEIVHHIDGNCQNNNLTNLMLFGNQSQHLQWHHAERQERGKR
jgi:hypothetical protein